MNLNVEIRFVFMNVVQASFLFIFKFMDITGNIDHFLFIFKSESISGKIDLTCRVRRGG